MPVRPSLRLPWQDRFQQPTIAELRESIKHPMLSIFDAARELLREEAGGAVNEKLAWQGLPWRWALVYTAEDQGERGLAYLVPDPQRLQIAVPLTGDLIAALPVRRLKKVIRDGITHAKSAAGIWWPTWDLTTRQSLDEVIELVRLKQKHLSPHASLAAAG